MFSSVAEIRDCGMKTGFPENLDSWGHDLKVTGLFHGLELRSRNTRISNTEVSGSCNWALAAAVP